MTKQIICRGHEFGGLYILDPVEPRRIACSGVTTPFETHCRLGHPSLPLLKKLCPQFAKHHRLGSRLRVIKRAGAPFELLHSDVWGPCPVVSPTGFRYFVVFVDDYA